ncbi:Asp23/Gls24 family envelope stress response protein [Nocardia puris]|uniref:Putative alkaline shock family protein YloU n=1 Tax=Nocardia puris TaxID=208602 RepID=A0A366DU49_9NOCA|nr:Asp23/Gls24 family envelope stress response protein [Nocardia puris]MBF6210205.1 Asp23/Gls24 family envelope stress response protein [Nocardia puris]MBF6367283.1 Asp23/Gls24 family envelope stress response protein [Nocardia puris]MBF6457466.1 Asp23/Gls24 family envelope stress response protein [Nocardia puris]RBO93621.1 putative alkaline shock family protein YloU [Nocardia puris]
MTAPVTVTVVEPAVIAAVAARAAAAAPGVVRLEPGVRGLVGTFVRAGRQRLAGTEPAAAEGVRARRTAAGAILVEVDVVLAADTHAAEVGAAVQREVTRVVAEQTGQEIDAVTVTILDIEPEA